MLEALGMEAMCRKSVSKRSVKRAKDPSVAGEEEEEVELTV